MQMQYILGFNSVDLLRLHKRYGQIYGPFSSPPYFYRNYFVSEHWNGKIVCILVNKCFRYLWDLGTYVSSINVFYWELYRKPIIDN